MSYKEIIMRADNITRSFPLAGGGKIQVLKGISVEIPKKSITLLRGRSGSGKTTLINILSALDYPTEGRVLFKDQDITKLSEGAREALRRKEIGIIFQSVSLIPIMTAYENVEFSLRLAGYEGDRKERVEKALRLVGLGARMHVDPAARRGIQSLSARASGVHPPQTQIAHRLPDKTKRTLAGSFRCHFYGKMLTRRLPGCFPPSRRTPPAPALPRTMR